MNNIPHVAILLAAYNGEKYIVEQLQSLIAQTHNKISIFVSDDSVNEETYNVIHDFIVTNQIQNIYYLKGPQLNFVQNFLSMVRNENIEADYYAFCDQDDIWHKNKISNALAQLERLDNNFANIYCGRTRLVDEDGSFIGYSPLFKKKPSFNNALVQNIAGGNTMVFKNTLKSHLASLPNSACISHDWLAYIISTATGGRVIYSEKADIDYRQHSSNIIGSNKGFFARLKRISLLLSGEYRKWNQQHDLILSQNKHIITPANFEVYTRFCRARNGNLCSRLYYFFKSKVYRQSFFGNVALLLGVILKKV